MITCNNIIRNKQGEIQYITNEDGSRSSLFDQLVERYNGDKEYALQLYLRSHTESFKKATGLDSATANIQDVIYSSYDQRIDTGDIYTNRIQVLFNKSQIANDKQKETINKFIQTQSNIRLSESGEHYVDSNNNEYTRVSNVIGTTFTELYDKDGQPLKDFEANRQWGNAFDAIATNIINGVDNPTILDDEKIDMFVSPEVKQQFAEQFKKTVQELTARGEVLLSQVIVYDNESRIAGSIDVVRILTDGTVEIYDLKSSYNSFLSDTYKNKELSSADGSIVRTKFTTHQLQLSHYKGLMDNQLDGITRGLYVIPAFINKLSDTDSTVATGVELQSLILAPYLKDIVNTNLNTKTEVTLVEDNDTTQLIADILQELYERLERLQSRNVKNQKEKERQIQEIIKQIKAAQGVKKIHMYVLNAHNLLVGSNKDGMYYTVKQIIQDIQQNKSTISNSIERLQNIHETVQLFETLKEVEGLYAELGLPSELQDDIIYNKLNEAIKAANNINKLYEKQIKPLVAQRLADAASNVSPEIKQQTELRVKRITNRIKRLEETKSKTSNSINRAKIDAQIGVLKRELSKLDELVDNTQASLLQELDSASKSHSWFDFWFNPLISAADSVLGVTAKIVKEAIEQARISTVNNAREIAKAYEQYRDTVGGSSTFFRNQQKFNEKLLEKVIKYRKNEAGQWESYEVLSLIQPINISAYNQKKHEYFQKEGENVTLQNFYDTYNEAMSADIILENIKLFEQSHSKSIVGQWLYNNTTSSEQRKQVTKGEWDYEAYYDYMIDLLERGNNTLFNKAGGEFTQPKTSLFASDKYQELQKDQAAFSYYNIVKKQYLAAQSKLPEKDRLGLFMPYIKKSSRDFAIEGQYLKSLTEWTKNGVLRELDTEDMQEQYGSAEIKTIPVYFTQRGDMTADQQSQDVAGSIMQFIAAANRYDALSNIKPEIDAILTQVEKRQPNKLDAGGKKILNKFKTIVGDKVYNKYVKEYGNNYAAMHLAAFIDSQFYGRTIKQANVPFFGKRVLRLDQLAKQIVKFGSLTQIGGNPFLGITNSLMSHASLIIEQAAGQFYNRQDVLFAKKEYAIQAPSLGKDMFNPYNKSKIGQLRDLFSPGQGEYINSLGKKVSHTNFSKVLSSSTWYAPTSFAENHIKDISMIAALHNVKVPLKDGNTISLYEAYIINEETGDLILREDVLNKEELFYNQSVQNRIHALYKRMEGVYDEFNKPEIERTTLGVLLMQYRKFLIPGFKRRFKSVGIDQELGSLTEGYYKTAIRIMTTDIESVMNLLKKGGTENSVLTELEIANLRRFGIDMAIKSATIIMVMLLSAMYGSGDDDEKSLLAYPLYLSMRLSSELNTYNSPSDIYRSIRTPLVSYSILEKTVRVLNQLGNPTEVYKRDSGIFEKGDNKLKAYILKLIGFGGSKYDAATAIDILQKSKL